VVRAPTMDAALQLLLDGKCNVLAGLRDRLMKDAARVQGATILQGQFMAVQQAIGVPRSRGREAENFLSNFVEEVKVSGLVRSLIDKHQVTDRLLVAPLVAAQEEPPTKRLCVAPQGLGSTGPGDAKAASKVVPASREDGLSAQSMKIAILGCGAMGSVYAGLLASGGHEVWAVDTWREHIDAIRKDGLRVEGASGDRTVKIHATCEPDDVGLVDLVVIATKASAVGAAAAVAARLVRPDGVILTIQNGLGSGDRIAQHVKTDKVMLGIASNFGASMKGPGHAEHKSMNLICIGEMAGGMTKRLQRVVDAWATSGFKVKACENINAMIWEKFICNCTYSGSATLTGMTVGEVQDCPSAWAVALACAREADAVARAQGIPLGFDDVEEYVRKFGSTVRAARPSMLQDHLAKRRSEIDAINGAVPIEAAKVGMEAPVNQTVADLVRARESVF